MSFSLQGGWWMDPGGIFSNSHHVNVYSGVHCFEIWLCELDHRLREIGRHHKTLRTYWNSRRFANDIFKSIFLSEEFSVLIEMALKFVLDQYWFGLLTRIAILKITYIFKCVFIIDTMSISADIHWGVFLINCCWSRQHQSFAWQVHCEGNPPMTGECPCTDDQQCGKCFHTMM